MVAGADKVELLSLCGPGGGGNYLLRSFEGREVNQGMWLCAVTEHVLVPRTSGLLGLPTQYKTFNNRQVRSFLPADP